MADQHVALSSGFSALGAGNLNPLDNELIEAPEDEDDFDILNDETFGDVGDDGFDWEEQHKKFAEELEGNSFYESKQCGNKTQDSGIDSTEKSYRSQEEFMERSIRQLVVDEDDEKNFTDPAILNASSNRSIPQREPHLENLFGPSSPPAFLDAVHLVSPTSKNIWGSPARDSPFSKPVNNIQALFDFAKVANADSPVPTSTPTIIKAKSTVPNSPVVPACAQTLAEIENQLLKKKAGPMVMTAEELERQLRGETTPARRRHVERTLPQPGSIQPIQEHQSPFSMPVPIPLVPRPVGHMMPNLTQPPPGFSPQAVHLPDGRNSPIQYFSGTPPMRNSVSPVPRPDRYSPVFMGMPSSSPLSRSFTPPPVGGIPLARASSPIQARLMSPYGQGAVLMGNAISPNRMFSTPMGIPRPGQMTRYGPIGSPSGPRLSHPMPASDPTHLMRGSRSAHYPNSNSFQHVSPGHFQPEPWHLRNINASPYQYFRDPQQYRNNRDDRPQEDEYSGLMTQREKDWIIKIQLMQLQTDNPYLDDYYYTYFTLKKKNRERQKRRENGVSANEKDDPKLVIPNLAKVETKTYTPAQFEGSLGRLTTASVHNPRTIIDLAKNVSKSTEETSKNVSKELRRFRQLLMDIEKGYNLLLEIDDLEKKVLALPEESRIPLLQDRHQKIILLFKYLSADDNIETFIQIMSVQKGRKLLSRVLPLLDKYQAPIMVSLILCNLSQLMKKDQSDEGLTMLSGSLSKAIGHADLEMLVRIAEQLQEDKSVHQGRAVISMLQNKLGSNLLYSMLRKAEDIYEDTSPVDMDNQLQTTWCSFVEEFVEGLAATSSKSLIPPELPHPSIAKHLERLLNKKLVASVEDRLELLTTPAESPPQS